MSGPNLASERDNLLPVPPRLQTTGKLPANSTMNGLI